MTSTAIVQSTGAARLPVEVERKDGGLTVRWEGREVQLRGSSDELREYLEALEFCYEMGFDDASNPRLFVP